jgi:hypothetical protein
LQRLEDQRILLTKDVFQVDNKNDGDKKHKRNPEFTVALYLQSSWPVLALR